MGSGNEGGGNHCFLVAAKGRAEKKMHIRWDPSSLDLHHISVSEHLPILDEGVMTMN